MKALRLWFTVGWILVLYTVLGAFAEEERAPLPNGVWQKAIEARADRDATKALSRNAIREARKEADRRAKAAAEAHEYFT